MRNLRLIARLDIKAPNLVKSIQLEGLRKMGDPNSFAKNYYKQGIDEILYIDIVASLYERNSLQNIIEKTTDDIFVPITVGGGLRSINDVTKVLRSGADKVCINTAAIKDESLICRVADKFGSQCMVLSIEAKSNAGRWEAYFDNGREHTYRDVVEWAKRGEELGAGEILLTSVDQEGTGKGFDNDLVKAVTDEVNIPVIASGGMGCFEDLRSVVHYGNADAIAIANVLHYGKISLPDIRSQCLSEGMSVRLVK